MNAATTHAARIKQCAAERPGGVTYGELLAESPDLSPGMLRLVVHRLRVLGDLRKPNSRRGGVAPLVQLTSDTAPQRRPVALRGAAAFIMRRVLAGRVFLSLADVEDEFASVRSGEYTQGPKAVYQLRKLGVLDPDMPLTVRQDADFSFED